MKPSAAAAIWAHIIDSIPLLVVLAVINAAILAIGRRFELGRVIVWIPILRLPVGSDESTSLLKVGRLVDVLLAPLDFGLHAAPSLAPISEVGVRLLISPLVRQLLVLVGEPDLLQLLLFDVSGRIILIVVAASFKLIDRGELRLLVAVSEERFVRGLVCRALRLLELPGGA